MNARKLCTTVRATIILSIFLCLDSTPYILVSISRIPKFRAKMFPNATDAIPGDEESYVVELDVFHQLHCLVESHYPHKYARLSPRNDIYMSHCLDSIRQSLLCSADVSLIVWQWDAEAGQSLPRGYAVHHCRDFDRIKEWAVTRQLDDKLNTKIHVVYDLPSPPLLY
ncbi:hypothetical protein BDN71DRAFT_1397470 [Pleurotus eryngii]|uniref:Uncharacterized protein n=1 Tax=Pleurotus eryngii TaxID=5323 RepID=A0A9P6D483_PLEER|nr:hypothetical protein BDN71DRAFT_1397470 [Pleurotus eryngii]